MNEQARTDQRETSAFPRFTVLVQSHGDYGGSSEFWVKWRGDAESPEEALRTAFAGDTWRPRSGAFRTIDCAVVGPEIGWQEFEVRVHYPASTVEHVKPTKLWMRQFDDDED